MRLCHLLVWMFLRVTWAVWAIRLDLCKNRNVLLGLRFYADHCVAFVGLRSIWGGCMLLTVHCVSMVDLVTENLRWFWLYSGRCTCDSGFSHRRNPTEPLKILLVLLLLLLLLLLRCLAGRSACLTNCRRQTWGRIPGTPALWTVDTFIISRRYIISRIYIS